MPAETEFVTLPLREEARRLLLQFGEGLLRKTGPAEQENFCREIARRLRLDDFPFIFAGVLLANHKRFREAIHLFSLLRGNAFISALTSYLAKKKSLCHSTHLFQSAAPLDAWTRTPISRLEMRATIDAFGEFALADRRLVKGKPLAILDIGTGNGILLSHLVNRLALSRKFPAARLFLLDSSLEMLRVATRNCRRLISTPVEISTIHSRIESMDKTRISTLKGEGLTFAIAASCLHHLPKKTKVSALSLIRTLSPALLLEELEANHDLPGKDSPELIWSVEHFYDSLITSVRQSKLTAQEKRICISDFLLAEAVGIISNPKAARGNYHTLLNQWTGIARASGFQVVGVRTKKLNKCGLHTLALNLNAEGFISV